VLFFYCVTILFLGLNLPYNSPYLQFANGHQSLSAAASPFVALMKQANIVALSGLLNGAITIFILSSANSDLYIGTRTLYGLAIQGSAPRIFARTDKRGVPYFSLAFCSVVSCLAYVVAKNDAREVFGYFVELVTVNGLITWASILYCHICFLKARHAQNVSSSDLKYKAPFGIIGSWIGLAVCVIFLLTKGLEPIVEFKTGRISTAKFAIRMATSYIGIVLFVLAIAIHKVVRKTKHIRPEQADLFGGKDEIDREEDAFLARQAQDQSQGARSKWSWIYHHSIGYIL
jgi:yeast amino acid transporter